MKPEHLIEHMTVLAQVSDDLLGISLAILRGVGRTRATSCECTFGRARYDIMVARLELDAVVMDTEDEALIARARTEPAANVVHRRDMTPVSGQHPRPGVSNEDAHTYLSELNAMARLLARTSEAVCEILTTIDTYRWCKAYDKVRKSLARAKTSVETFVAR